MNGKNTFTLLSVDGINQPLLYKLKNLKRTINKNFKYIDIRYSDIDYEQNNNLYKYMKHLAFLKYKKKNLIKILKKYNIDIFNKKELYKLKRRNSHDIPYHKKTYHKIIYRNFYNYQYKPYVLPLNKEIKLNYLTDYKSKKYIKEKRNIFFNPYLDKKIIYLNKISQRIKEKNKNKNSKILEYKNLRNYHQIRNNNSVSNFQTNDIKKYKNYSYIKNINSLPKINYDNYANNISLENILNDDKINSFKKEFSKSLNVNKNKNLVLPKIRDNCLSAIKNSNEIEKNLKIYKNGKKESKNVENKCLNNLLKFSPSKLYKMLYKSDKSKTKIITKRNKINSSNKKTSKNKSSIIKVKKDYKETIINSNEGDINLNKKNEILSDNKKVLVYNGLV